MQEYRSACSAGIFGEALCQSTYRIKAYDISILSQTWIGLPLLLLSWGWLLQLYPSYRFTPFLCEILLFCQTVWPTKKINVSNFYVVILFAQSV